MEASCLFSLLLGTNWLLFLWNYYLQYRQFNVHKSNEKRPMRIEALRRRMKKPATRTGQECFVLCARYLQPNLDIGKGTGRDPVRIVAIVPNGADEWISIINVQIGERPHRLTKFVVEAQPGAAAFECARASPDGGSSALPTSRLYKVSWAALCFTTTKEPGGLRQRSKGESACEGV
ncbi:unnamed protein product [Nippostrongylus brasiliensis]|uniref:DUF5641 domain-containing protein n=1 Tax=Nippostrongylus brasiliensis TaxID=27835 RepID=A0A158R1A8_NIPBR|nr:unnamed protein product [Nippostrongylus brasiliensis]